MRPKGSKGELERRRRRALVLVKEGFSLNEVARRLGCNASSVKRWRDSERDGGEDALKAKPTPGRPPRLTAVEKEKLAEFLLEGSLAHGYRTDLWTTLRIAQVIEKKFGVHYHRDHVGRLLHSFKWSHQKPERRAAERDEEAIEEWKKKKWPRLKKTPRGWAPTSPSSTNRGSF